MTQPPAELSYGTVSWWVASLLADTLADVNDLPDLSLIQGKAYVHADVTADGLFVQETDTPLTILNSRVELLIVNGRLQDKAGNQNVKLLANDAPGLAQTGWTYTLEFALTDGLTFGSFPFELRTGEHVDLTLAVPLDLDPSTGALIVKGPKGDQGPPGVGTEYVHTQASASSSWVITHNLNRRPVVFIIVDDQPVYADVTYASLNQVSISFPTAVAGEAHLL